MINYHNEKVVQHILRSYKSVLFIVTILMISYSNMWIYTVSIFKYFNDRMFIKTATVKNSTVFFNLFIPLFNQSYVLVCRDRK